MPDFKLIAPGASPEQIARGEAAAQAVFDAAGVTAHQAAVCSFRLDMAERDLDTAAPQQTPLLGLAEQEWDAAMAWMDASEAAINACCAGWAERPDGWIFTLTDDPKEAKSEA